MLAIFPVIYQTFVVLYCDENEIIPHKGGNAVCIDDRADVSDKTAVRRWRRFPVWGEGPRQITHSSRPLLKFPPTSNPCVAMRREGPPSQVSAFFKSVRIRNVSTFVYVELEDS